MWLNYLLWPRSLGSQWKYNLCLSDTSLETASGYWFSWSSAQCSLIWRKFSVAVLLTGHLSVRQRKWREGATCEPWIEKFVENVHGSGQNFQRSIQSLRPSTGLSDKKSRPRNDGLLDFYYVLIAHKAAPKWRINTQIQMSNCERINEWILMKKEHFCLIQKGKTDTSLSFWAQTSTSKVKLRRSSSSETKWLPPPHSHPPPLWK